MKAEILSIGTELILGQIVDTNAAYLASELPQLGIDLYWISQVGDNQPRVVELLRRAWDRSDLILVTGGLGPTEDDVTRESIAELLGEPMTVDPDLEKWLRGLFARVGWTMPECNIKQAMRIPSARAIPNSRGSAPGWWVEKEGRILLAMPGPPAEMQHMWEKEIREKLRERIPTAIIVSRTIKLLGIGEANVDEMLSPLLHSRNPSIGTYAKPTGIELRITAKAPTRAEAEALIAPVESRIRTIVGEKIWGTDDETLEKIVGDLLRIKRLSLATMESCTGGLLSALITDVPGSSDYFKGGIISYSNEAKIAFGVNAELIEGHGAVSAPVALGMADAARRRFDADIGVGVTGVAGPDAIEGKPVGTMYIGLSGQGTSRSFHAVFPQHRTRVKQYAALAALNELRKFLLELK